MKALFPSLLMVLLFIYPSFGQSYSEDFESFADNDKIAVVSPTRWVTWSNTPGSAEDAPVVSERANSGSKSLKLFNTNPAVGPMDVVLRFGQKYSTGNFSYQMYMFLEEGKAAYFNFQRENSIGTAMAGSVYVLCCSFRLFDAGQFHVARVIDHTFQHIQVIDSQIQGIKIRRGVAPELNTIGIWLILAKY
jgi:hypothetical protein